MALANIINRTIAAIALASMAIAPAQAQSILRDAETEAFLKDLSKPLITAAGLSPENVDIVLVNDKTVNAFVMGGQAVYINSGLIDQAETAAEIQGVIAHELGHVVGGHAVLNQGAKPATNISLLSLVLGAAAIAAGGGDAAMGILMAGQQASVGQYMAYTRTQEATADAAGARYLSRAGISGRGSLSFFHKLQNLEYRAGYRPKAEDQFYASHPLTSDRIQILQDTYEQDRSWAKPDDKALQERFVRIKAKLYGYLAETRLVFQAYPETNQSLNARYARAYAYHRESRLDMAQRETNAMLAANPNDAYALELDGQILLESGKPSEALAPLRKAVDLTDGQPLIATLFGHALIATEDATHFAEAEGILKNAVARDRENPATWYQLGTIYATKGDMARARLASAEQQSLNGQTDAAIMSAKYVQSVLPTGSPDWIRAQDIELAARETLSRGTKNGFARD